MNRLEVDGLTIVARSDWGATSPQSRGKRAPKIIQPRDRRGVVLHWNGPPLKTDGTEAADRRKALATWRYHTNPKPQGRNWSDGSYSFKVGQSGTVYEERGLLWDQFANGSDQVGADDGADSKWYSVMLLIGEGEEPTEAAIDSIRRLIAGLRAAGAGNRVLPHSDIRRKACPGPHLAELARSLDRQPIEILPVTSDPNNGIEDALKRVRATRRRAKATVNAMDLAEAALLKELNR